MQMTPQMQGVGCIAGLVNLGALVSGIYYGMAQAKGVQVDHQMENLCKYGAMVAGSVIGLTWSGLFVSDQRNLDEFVQNAAGNMPREQAEGCAKGCMPISGIVMGAVSPAIMSYVGYTIGGVLGKQF